MNPLRAWNAFWFRPTSARPLGAFRVAVGLLALAQLGLLAVESDYWLSGQGLLRGAEAREIAGPWRPSPLQWVQDPTTVRLFLGATALAAALVTIGWRTKVSSVVLYLGMLSIMHRNLPSHCGPDSLLMLTLFYCMLSPCGAAYSLDARRAARRRGTLAEPLIVPWAQRLIQLQVAVVYFVTAVLKANGATWLGGTALHFVLNNGEFGRFPALAALTQYPILVNLLTLGGLLTEFALPFLLWFRPTRPYAIAAGVALHAGILVMLNIPLFGELMVATYLLFLTPGEFEALRAALRFRRETPTGSAGSLPGRADSAEAPRGPHAAVPSRVGVESDKVWPVA